MNQEQVDLQEVMQAKREDRLPSWEWEALRQKALERDDYCCVKCKSQDSPEVDHIRAKCFGGKDELDNLQTLCYEHHKEKTKQDVHKNKMLRMRK